MSSAATRPWRWPTYSRLLLQNEYQRDFIRSQQAEVEQLRTALNAARTFVELAGYTLVDDAALLDQIDEALAVRG